jgi:hypothetical protein
VQLAQLGLGRAQAAGERRPDVEAVLARHQGGDLELGEELEAWLDPGAQPDRRLVGRGAEQELGTPDERAQ